MADRIQTAVINIGPRTEVTDQELSDCIRREALSCF